MERLGALQGRTQRTHNSDFESVENPGDTQTYDDQQVKPTPGQSIEAERNVGPDHGRGLQLRHPDHFRLSGRVEKAAGNRVTTRWRSRSSKASGRWKIIADLYCFQSRSV